MNELEQSLREAKQSRPLYAGGNARLAHENRVRGDLLCVVGIDRATQERFIKAAPTTSVLAQSASDAVESLRGQGTAATFTPEKDGIYEHSIDRTEASDIGSLVHDARLLNAAESHSNIPALVGSLSAQLLPPEHGLCATCSTTSTPSSRDGDASDSTTACSIAFSMVLSNNKRGYELKDLESRMQAGYQNAVVPGEECRVLNRVLFEVLTEIA